MRSSKRQAAGSAGGFLKTCNTCFLGKIRCDRSQGSGPCDRCLRLGKECVFPPRRHNHKSQVRNNRPAGSQPDSGPDQVAPPSIGSQAGRTTHSQSLPQPLYVNGLDDPLVHIHSWINVEKQGELLGLFRTRLSPRFPFVVIPEDVKPEDMYQQRPCTHLAILGVASSADFVLQRKLSGLFNQVLTARLASGKLATLDVLQGLLLHIAWYVPVNLVLDQAFANVRRAHYQNRPRSYTQQLHLATSIVTDLRLERPRRQQLWSVDKSNEGTTAEWPSDELRAMIGTYYLASW